ncbi:MAG: aldehyde dehydrogenase family protein [Paracoccaceae bacterium]
MVSPAQLAESRSGQRGRSGRRHAGAGRGQLPAAGSFCAPGLLLGTDPANPCWSEEIFGPIATLTTFRTPAEAVELANNTRYGLPPRSGQRPSRSR